jgi:hypothetical protein
MKRFLTFSIVLLVFLPGAYLNVAFVRDSNEEVEKMRIVDGGQVFYANRVK